MVRVAGDHPKKPVIGVTGNHRALSPSWFCLRLAIRFAGGIPLRISVRHEVDRDRLQGLVISGGDDIHPSIYQAEAQPRAVYDPDRDALERDYIGFALERELPVLGICRGYQLLNAHCGGNLYTDIRSLRRETSNFATILPRKTVNLVAGSRMSALFSTDILKVNSLHYQAVDRPAEVFDICGRDLDDFPQAIEHNGGREIMGVQWHPEYMLYLPRQRRLFQWLVAAARRDAGQPRVATGPC
jgi:putative glutamine amidotransferase